MKTRFFLLMLILAGAGVFYMYQTDAAVKSKIDGIITGFRDNTVAQEDSISAEGSTDPVGDKKSKRKAKTLDPDEFARLDKYARNTPSEYETDIPTLAKYLLKKANSDMDKARLAFTWVATNIKYDVAGLQNDNIGDCSTEAVLKSRVSVCEGYSNVFGDLVTAMGLENQKIIGYAKAYNYTEGQKLTETDHAWNAVKINGVWKLCDVTWASGHVDYKGKDLVFIGKFAPFWFSTDPKAFIFHHLPEEDQWQLTSRPITLSEYEKIPFFHADIFMAGFNTPLIFQKAIEGKTKRFVNAYRPDFPFQILDAPYERVLPVGKPIKFVFESDYAENIVLIDGNTSLPLKQKGNRFELEHAPIHEELFVAYKINRSDKNYTTLLLYEVGNPQPVSVR